MPSQISLAKSLERIKSFRAITFRDMCFESSITPIFQDQRLFPKIAECFIEVLTQIVNQYGL